MTGNPFPVMHGSMWKEPQTVDECLKTDCKNCSYRGVLRFCNDGISPYICEHLCLMRNVERLKQ
jgi:hypothetical protein